MILKKSNFIFLVGFAVLASHQMKAPSLAKFRPPAIEKPGSPTAQDIQQFGAIDVQLRSNLEEEFNKLKSKHDITQDEAYEFGMKLHSMRQQHNQYDWLQTLMGDFANYCGRVFEHDFATYCVPAPGQDYSTPKSLSFLHGRKKDTSPYQDHEPFPNVTDWRTEMSGYDDLCRRVVLEQKRVRSKKRY